jgi:hypothetical protein
MDGFDVAWSSGLGVTGSNEIQVEDNRRRPPLLRFEAQLQVMMQEVERRCGKFERLGLVGYTLRRPMELLEQDDWFFVRD